MGVVVQFNFNQWVTRYPEFSSLNPDLAQQYFNEAGLYMANDGSGPVNNLTTATLLMNMLTAHIAWLNRPTDPANPANASSPIVGRISSATEGSVTVQTENQYPEGTPQWFQQTKYGSAWWSATTKYRRFLYAAHPQRVAVGPYVGPYGRFR